MRMSSCAPAPSGARWEGQSSLQDTYARHELQVRGADEVSLDAGRCRQHVRASRNAARASSSSAPGCQVERQEVFPGQELPLLQVRFGVAFCPLDRAGGELLAGSDRGMPVTMPTLGNKSRETCTERDSQPG